MKKTIAICTDIEIFNNNKIFDIEFSNQFIGAGIYPELKKHLSSEECDVVTGDVAIMMLNQRDIIAKNILVISDMHSSHGLKLIRRGATPLLSFCLESPLVAVDFYDDLFSGRLFFNHYFALSEADCFPEITSSRITTIDFPSLEVKQIANRKYKNNVKEDNISFIAANKWVEYKAPRIFERIDPFEVMKRLYSSYRFYTSRTRKLQSAIDLHTKRFEAVVSLMNKKTLVVAGTGWDKVENYPDYLKAYSSFFSDYHFYLGKVEDKLEFLAKYKFSLCCENANFDGYNTEKIVHCLFAGTIPLYLGSNTVKKNISENLFIDIAHLTTSDILEIFEDKDIYEQKKTAIENLDDSFYYKYTYLVFAEKVKNLLRSHL